MIHPPILILAANLVVSLLIVAVLRGALIRLGRPARNETFGSEPRCKRAQLENLDSQDISFLLEHPALARTVIRELRSERRRVLREYLRSLRSDFNQTCAEIKAAIVASSADRPELVDALFKQQVRFKLGLMKAECSMIMEAIGLVAVDLNAIIDALGAIRLTVKRLAATELHPFGEGA